MERVSETCDRYESQVSDTIPLSLCGFARYGRFLGNVDEGEEMFAGELFDDAFQFKVE